jgi:hypothetical protein
MFFARVPLKIMDMRHIVRRPGRVGIILLEEVRLPLAPFTACRRLPCKHTTVSRPDSSALPSRKSLMSIPSICRSAGTFAPPASSTVVNVSTSCTSSLLTLPAGTLPGQGMIHGARLEPSSEVT